MSTSLYKSLKSKGATFYAFPSTSYNTNPDFSKFVLLRIPKKEDSRILDFDYTDLNGNSFDVYTTNNSKNSTYADQLIESLRNYVANQDTVFRESKLSARKEFYNINEYKTPTEKIFWKWLRKFGAIDFEPAEHKVDWDKNLTDFDNPNGDTTSNTDYFRKYLWKEREVRAYTISYISYEGLVTGLGSNIAKILITYPIKLRKNDIITMSGSIGTQLSTDTEYEVLKVENISSTEAYVYISDSNFNTSVSSPSATLSLVYNRVVQYVGEINVKSNVKTATKNDTAVTAYIPHQAGSTPTVLFDIDNDTNYYPNLELPILADELQAEIKGAQNYTSPIRQNPSEYPGMYYGQFDTANKTYKCSTGDKLRYSGKYYGIILNSNVGLSADDYVETLSVFDSSNIDGLGIDFNLNHYYKMEITDTQVGFNFDEFNQLSIDGNAPSDFEYNAVLWYYDVEDNDGNIHSNLYGITFLNNPNESENGDFITPYVKYVSTEEHDGVTYNHTLNLSTSIDNDTSSLAFDSLALNDTFGFDLYSNVMSNVGKLNESFLNMISQFITINSDVNDMKSLIYSQTDINLIKTKLKNMEELLKLYSTYQFVNSDSVEIESNFSGMYPTLAFNVKSIEYGQIYNLKASEIYSYMSTESLSEYKIATTGTNKIMVNITNDDMSGYNTALGTSLGILIKNDLTYKQRMEINLIAKEGLIPDEFTIYMNVLDGSTTTTKVKLIDKIFLPIDIGSYDTSGVKIYHKNKYHSRNISEDVNLVKYITDNSGELYLYTAAPNVFGDSTYSEYVYVEDLFFKDSNNVIYDYSGMHKIGAGSLDFNDVYIRLYDTVNAKYADIANYTHFGVPKIHTYKNVKIIITRINSSDTSSVSDRYSIEKIIY